MIFFVTLSQALQLASLTRKCHADTTNCSGEAILVVFKNSLIKPMMQMWTGSPGRTRR